MMKNNRLHIHLRHKLMLLLLLFMVGANACAYRQDSLGHIGNREAEVTDTSAVKFKVTGFRVLSNDVSAFITPVRDLNNEACALLKVVARQDFAFSSPLGIVKRKDEVGEIWLYLPKGTRRITIKHPRWGVLRNYRLPLALESHVAYEMTISEPRIPMAYEHDTVILTKTIVDTVAVKRKRPRLPMTFHALFTLSMHQNGPSWGVMLAAMRRHGMFVHVSSDFRSIGNTRFTCDEEGYIDDSGTMPYYTGETRHSNWTATAGAIHRLCSVLSVFEGIGYGRAATAWQLAESEGGGSALNDGLTHKGVAGELGLMATFGRINISASVLTIAGQQWQGCVGVGIKL
ncbi:uncharacterized protein BN487_00079 [Prevotella sp. CAG:1320]|nr:uncharacterized protein BN487_00079 [Prevotella sp. CAG:1320]